MRQKGGFYRWKGRPHSILRQKGGFYGVGIKRLYGLVKKNVGRKARKLWQKGQQSVRRKAVKVWQEAIKATPQKGGWALGQQRLPTLHPNDAVFFTEAWRRRQRTEL